MAKTTVKVEGRSLMPECIGNVIKSADALSRALLIGCEGIEKVTEGVSEITSIHLSQYKAELLKDSAPA